MEKQKDQSKQVSSHTPGEIAISKEELDVYKFIRDRYIEQNKENEKLKAYAAYVKEKTTCGEFPSIYEDWIADSEPTE